MSSFQPLLDSVQATDRPEHFSAGFDPSWLQGRTAFGGLSAALVVQAMVQRVPADRRLRALSVAFVGPVPAGQHEVRLRPLREGGSVTHIQGELVCAGEVATVVTAAFGKDRSDSLRVATPPMPQATPYAELESFPIIKGVTPDFMQHYELRHAKGALPLSGGDKADFQLWMRFRDPCPTSIAALVALADVPSMPGLNMITAPGVGSSLTWYLEFPVAIPEVTLDDWWFMDYRCQGAEGGYFNNYGTVWSPAGEALMFSRQTAMVFEQRR